MTGSADTSAGMPFGVKRSEFTAPRPSAIGTPIGLNMPAFGSCSTITSLASPHVVPNSASRFDRPTVHAGYCPIIAAVSENTSNATSAQVRIAKGDWIIRCQLLSAPSSESRPEKWNHAAANSTSTVSPSSMVVKPKWNSGNEFDHGTPKFETYQ